MKDFEAISLMEPLLVNDGERRLEDLAFELIHKSSLLAGQLNPTLRNSIGNLVRSMNCYYSNFIEGHNTHPRDIDKALAKEFSSDKKRRSLQQEALAHIEVQRLIDFADKEINPVSIEYIKWLHFEFCSRLPDDLLMVENPDTKAKIKVTPGEFRESYVQVGRHIPPSASAVENFMLRFSKAYDPSHLSKLKRILAVPCSHHRLLWIHPFYDGNGRVTRLISHAYFKQIGIGNSLWSVSRGLARNARRYKELLMQADEPRQGDLDGRGNLSLKALTAFCEFFLECCIDQVEYMGSLIEPKNLLNRIEIYVEEEVRAGRLLNGSFSLLREAFLAGSFERGKAPEITGYKDRQARSVLSKLIDSKLLISDSDKGAVRLNFPIDVVERWFPKLYPDLI
ncbi:MAG: Fic family protein [Candidatus Caenarcaniphilales bacterium]|nr:Fic family protein [Candidatus Caenarcaniphilales bacterium]